MPTEYYLWQWADNDLPADPATIVNQLTTGELPPPLQRFLVRNVYSRLYQTCLQQRCEWSEVCVDPQAEAGGLARFIRFRHPLGGSPQLAQQLLAAVWDTDLTVYNATTHRLIGLPKRNLVEFPSGRQLVDIEAADVPGLLHQLSGQPELTALACYDQDGNMFQVWSHQRRYAVEWQILPARDIRLHRICVAGRATTRHRRVRLGTFDCGLNLFQQELLGLADVHQLWLAFLGGATRPSSHTWRDVTRQLDHPGQPTRHGRVSVRVATAHCRFGSN